MDIRERDCAAANGDHRIAMTVINGGDRRRKLCGCLLYQRVYAVLSKGICRAAADALGAVQNGQRKR